LKHVVVIKLKGMIEVAGRQWGSRKQLLGDLKERWR